MDIERTSINKRRECWYIVDAKWLNSWANFVLHVDEDHDEPKAISTRELHEANGQLLDKLEVNVDYRYFPLYT